MAKNYVPDGKVALLVGDKGQYDAFPTHTKVNGVRIASTIEEQSTTRLHTLPRMSTVQMAAVSPAVDGMMGYDTTLNDLIIRKNGVLTQVTANPTGLLFASGFLTATEVDDMFDNPIEIIPTPGPGNLIVVKQVVYIATFGDVFTGGGDIGISYSGNTPIDQGVDATILTTDTENKFAISAPISQIYQTFDAEAGAIFISNATAAFADGGTSTLAWFVWYSIIEVS